MKNKFRNANAAYEYLHDKIIREGIDFANTKALFNVGFYIYIICFDSYLICIYYSNNYNTP